MIGWSWIVLLIDGKSACVWLLLRRHTDNIYTLGRPISSSICLLGVLWFHPTMLCHAILVCYLVVCEPQPRREDSLYRYPSMLYHPE